MRGSEMNLEQKITLKYQVADFKTSRLNNLSMSSSGPSAATSSWFPHFADPLFAKSCLCIHFNQYNVPS